MPLEYLNKDAMRSIIIPTWQKELNTGQDPGSKWAEDGPNHDGIGLYGGLNDEIDTVVHFDEANKSYSKADIIVAYSVVDNRNGLNPNNQVTLSYTYAKTQTQTHSVSSSIRTDLKINVDAKASIFGIGVDSTTVFNFDYSYDMSSSSSTSQSEQTTLSQDVKVSVPTGKVYQVQLIGTRTMLTVPTTSYVRVAGMSETWFPEKVQGHYNWMESAGELFDNVKKLGTAGMQSSLYGSDGEIGLISLPGNITGINMINFYTTIVDITPQVAPMINPAQFYVNMKDSDLERLLPNTEAARDALNPNRSRPSSCVRDLIVSALFVLFLYMMFVFYNNFM